jgi:hypothetical protein
MRTNPEEWSHTGSGVTDSSGKQCTAGMDMAMEGAGHGIVMLDVLASELKS